MKSYQSKLQSSVSVSGSYSGLNSFSFELSGRYKDFQKKYQYRKSVFFEKSRVCYRGSARYEQEKARGRSDFRLADGFAAAIRALPLNYSRNEHNRFLDEWGTHVVTGVRVGSKYTEHFRSSFQKAYTYALNQYGFGTSASASFFTFSTSVSLKADKLTQDSSFVSSLRSTRKVTTKGSSIYWDTIRNVWVTPSNNEFTEPIAITIRRIDEFLTPAYTTDQTVLKRKSGLSKALQSMYVYSKGLYWWWLRPRDVPLTVPIEWPSGTYGLVRPSGSGCPSGWNSGYRYHDTEDSDSNNQWSSTLHLAGFRAKNNMRWEFCMKLFDNGIGYQWPKGQYCILKKSSCPHGFHDGWIFWDDEDHDNRNSAGGTLPDGTYDKNTKMGFCCRTDGNPDRAILLPTSKPFILVAATNRCQKVRGMSTYPQWFRWDDEDNDNIDSRSGKAPYDTGGSKDHKLHFCYYK
jgi:hypothetical protein